MCVWGNVDLPPASPHRGWALRQIIIMHNLAMRERWREQQFQAAIHGVDFGQEPEWNLGRACSGTESRSQHDAEFDALRRRKRGK